MRLIPFLLLICFFDAVLGIALFFCRPIPQSVSVLDVGQGAATLVSLGGAFVLIDSGVDQNIAFEVEKIMGYRRHIDAVVLSHPHSDHYGGLESIFKSYKVGAFIYDGESVDSDTLNRVIAEARKESRVVAILDHGSISFKDSRIVFLEAKGKKGDLNSESIIAKVSLFGFSALLPGDIGIKEESYLVSKDSIVLDADILVVPHHGSAGSSGESFIKAVSPEVVVFSLGKDNRYGFPKKEVVDRFVSLGIPIIRTDESGTIVLSLKDSDSLNIRRLGGALP